jgi:4-amino-4-deoxy-L-arabinose transferase-like glycosyltransferase
MKKIKNNIWLLAILLGGTALRLFYWLTLKDHLIFGDGGTHTLAGLAIARTFTHHFSPNYFADFIYHYWATMGSLFFYPWANTVLSAISFLLFGFNHLSAKLPSMVFSVLMIFAIYLLGKEIFNKKTGLWAAAIAAINPYFIFFGGSDLVDIQMTCLTTLAIYFCLKAKKSNRSRHYLLVGLFAGLAGLMKPPGFIIIIPAILIIVYHKNPKIILTKNFLYLILVFTALAFSYFGPGLIIKYLPASTPIQAAASSDILHWFGSAITFAEPGDPAWHDLAGWTYYIKILPEQLGWLPLLLAIIGGTLLTGGKDRDKKFILFANIAIIYLVFIFLDNKNGRYTLLYLPFWCILAGIEAKKIIDLIRQKKYLAAPIVLTVAIILFIDINIFSSATAEIKTKYGHANLSAAISAIVTDNISKENKLIVLYQDRKEIGIANVSFFTAINDPELIYSVYWEDKAAEADYLIVTGEKIQRPDIQSLYEPVAGYPVYAYKKLNN